MPRAKLLLRYHLRNEFDAMFIIVYADVCSLSSFSSLNCKNKVSIIVSYSQPVLSLSSIPFVQFDLSKCVSSATKAFSIQRSVMT